MTTLLLTAVIVFLFVGASSAARKVHARNLAEAQKEEDLDYLEACLNRERSHDFPMEFSAKKFEEGFWRGWNR